MPDDTTPADQLLEQAIQLLDAVKAFEKAHVEPQTVAEDFFAATTVALEDLTEVLLAWDYCDPS